jgi:hypothetical protein
MSRAPSPSRKRKRSSSPQRPPANETEDTEVQALQLRQEGSANTSYRSLSNSLIPVDILESRPSQTFSSCQSTADSHNIIDRSRTHNYSKHNEVNGSTFNGPVTFGLPISSAARWDNNFPLTHTASVRRYEVGCAMR